MRNHGKRGAGVWVYLEPNAWPGRGNLHIWVELGSFDIVAVVAESSLGYRVT